MRKKEDRLTAEQMVDNLIEWNKKFEKIRIFSSTAFPQNISAEKQEIIKKYSIFYGIPVDEIISNYIRMQQCYAYVNNRCKNGKLSPELIAKAKEADFRGNFGYPSRLERLSETYGVSLEKLGELDFQFSNLEDILKDSKKYGIELDKVVQIYKDHINMEVFIKEYQLGYLDSDLFIKVINVGKDEKYAKFFEKIYRNPASYADIRLGSESKKTPIVLCNSDELDIFLSNLKEVDRRVISLSFGLEDGIGLSDGEGAKLLGLNPPNYRDKKSKTIKKLLLFLKSRSVYLEDKDAIDKIFASNIILKKDFDRDDEISQSELFEIYQNCKKAKKENNTTKKVARPNKKITTNQTSEITIDKLNLSTRSYGVLSDNGITTVEQIRELGLGELCKLRGLGDTSINEIISKVKNTLNIPYEEIFYDDIDKLNLSVRTYNALSNNGVRTIEEIRSMGIDKLLQLRGMGEASIGEIIHSLSKKLDVDEKDLFYAEGDNDSRKQRFIDDEIPEAVSGNEEEQSELNSSDTKCKDSRATRMALRKMLVALSAYDKELDDKKQEAQDLQEGYKKLLDKQQDKKLIKN